MDEELAQYWGPDAVIPVDDRGTFHVTAQHNLEVDEAGELDKYRHQGVEIKVIQAAPSSLRH